MCVLCGVVVVLLSGQGGVVGGAGRSVGGVGGRGVGSCSLFVMSMSRVAISIRSMVTEMYESDGLGGSGSGGGGVCSCRRSNHSRKDFLARVALGLKRSSDAGVFRICSSVWIVVCKFVFGGGVTISVWSCGACASGWVGCCGCPGWLRCRFLIQSRKDSWASVAFSEKSMSESSGARSCSSCSMVGFGVVLVGGGGCFGGGCWW